MADTLHLDLNLHDPKMAKYLPMQIQTCRRASSTLHDPSSTNCLFAIYWKNTYFIIIIILKICAIIIMMGVRVKYHAIKVFKRFELAIIRMLLNYPIYPICIVAHAQRQQQHQQHRNQRQRACPALSVSCVCVCVSGCCRLDMCTNNSQWLKWIHTKTKKKKNWVWSPSSSAKPEITYSHTVQTRNRGADRNVCRVFFFHLDIYE